MKDKVNELITAPIFNRDEAEKVIKELSTPDFRESFKDFVKQNMANSKPIDDILLFKEECELILFKMANEEINKLI